MASSWIINYSQLSVIRTQEFSLPAVPSALPPAWVISLVSASAKPPEIRLFSAAAGFKVHLAGWGEQGIGTGDRWEFPGTFAGLQKPAYFFFSGRRVLQAGLQPLYTCFHRCKG